MAGESRPYDGRIFIADTSAWARAHAESVRAQWLAALRNGQIATCPIVNVELLLSTRNGPDYDRVAADLAELTDIPITRAVTSAALSEQRRLAHVQPLFQRSVKLPDLLIAAAAQEAALGVLHYDEDFDTLASGLHFESRWIAPRGSLS